MLKVKCPHCKKTVVWSEDFPFRPFCCERCKLIDLGSWADGSYAIPTSEPVTDEDITAIEQHKDENDETYDGSDEFR